MTTERITTENVSRELIKSTFDAAFMETSLDNDGDVIVKDACICLVIPDKEKRRIWLLTQFSFKPSASDAEKLTCANMINKDYIIVRACAVDKILRFSYDIVLDGDGITPKSLVFLVKRFCSIPRQAIQDYGINIVE
jgi:hypothetical protein